MIAPFSIAGRKIGPGEPVYIIAEMSSNHNQDYRQAVEIIHAAKDAGADAVKLQTFTPEVHTLDLKDERFCVEWGTPWDGKTLHELYKETYMPWDWQPKLKKVADEIGIALFSAVVDPTGVAFLEKMGVPAYKIPSFEMVDLPLIETAARTGKPLIISTGMATLEEIGDAVGAARKAGAREVALLKCTSVYPAPPAEMNLRTIPDLAETFGVPAGISDHTLGITIPIAAVAIGACLIEKHFTLSRASRGPDSKFSTEPQEFRAMVNAVREAEQALGTVSYTITEHEAANRAFRRSLFVVEDMRKGQAVTRQNVRSIRPGNGLPPKFLPQVLGMRVSRDVKRGEPLNWSLLEEK
ncbi:MAG: pseudaminic acid synthase [Methanomicrobiales archaeon]|nr:pseudaminic acid synthase [Methanomicrobiales archaeon]